MTSVSAGHIILTPTQPVGSGRPERKSNPRSPEQESRALPTEEISPPPPPPQSCTFAETDLKKSISFGLFFFSYTQRSLFKAI